MLKLGGHRGFGCTDHGFYQDKRDLENLPVENTLESIETAFLSGADFIECDLVMSGDGVLFVLHNVVPEDHFFGEKKPGQLLNKMNFEDIVLYKTGRLQKGIVARFSDVLDLVSRYDPHTLPFALNIEIKGVQGSNQSYEKNDFFEQIYNAVRKSSLSAERILWSSFCLENILKASTLFPESQFGMIFREKSENKAIYSDYSDDLKYQYFPFDEAHIGFVLDVWKKDANPAALLGYVHPEIMTIDHGLIDIISGYGLKMNCWTFHEALSEANFTHYKSIIKKADEKAVPLAIITDYLREMQQGLQMVA